MKPIKLYKYHKINGHLKEMLDSSQLWFSHQNELNDPYDCKYSLSDGFLKLLYGNSADSLKKDLPNCQEKIDNTVLSMLRSENCMNILYNMLFGGRLGWSACSFTTDPINELMWAFYADNYKGVCLEFDISKTLALYKKLNPVIYNNNLPEITSMDDLIKVLLIKKEIWSFEKEWRIISKINGKVDFNRDSLTNIIFGLKTQQADIKNVINILIENGYKNVKLKQIKFRIKGVTFNELNDLDV